MKHINHEHLHHLLVREIAGSFDFEVLRNERLRAIVLSALGVLMLLGFHFRLAALGHGDIGSDSPRLFWLRLAFGGFILYEGLFALLVTVLLRHKIRLPLFGRYANTIVEIFIAYLITWLASYNIPVSTALELPSSYLPFIIVALSSLRMSVALSFFTGIISALGYVVLFAILSGSTAEAIHFDPLINGGRVIAFSISGLLTGLVGFQIRQWMITTISVREDRERITRIFGSQVSPEVAEKLLSRDVSSDKGELRNVCIMFVDIRGFTAFSERRSPEEIVAFLNNVFSFTVDEVVSRKGIVNKFLGDGFMAVFGAPLDDPSACANALEAARAMLAALDDKKQSGDIPDIQIGIGLNAGVVLTGQVGGSVRREYTVIGDVVNSASRIESLNKEYRSRLLVGESVVDQAGLSAERLGLVEVGSVAVRGRDQTIKLFCGDRNL
jgi:adenylate cyclase